MLNNNNLLWEKVLDHIKVNTTVTQTAYNSFISQVKLREIKDNPSIAYLEAPTDFIASIIHRRYLHLFSKAFSEITGKDFKAIIKSSIQYKNLPSAILEQEPSNGFVDGWLTVLRDYRMFDPNFTFDNFVEGECNETAAAICKAVAESPGDLFNPFFLYGKSGLGKTHLLNAIGIYLLDNNPNIKVLYVSAETFISDFTTALQNHKVSEFKEKYRNPDVLLIDDIQFLRRADETKNELFYTFEHLHKEGKQIIFSGDRPPNEFTFFDERMVSRFMSNTVIDIKPPSYEMKYAILLKIAEIMGVTVDDDIKEIIEFIAQQNTENIRILRGHLTSVINISRQINQKPSLSFAKIMLKDISKSGVSVTPQQIKSEVANHYNIKISDLESTSRKAEYAYPRQIAMYLCRTMTDYSLPRIGDIFGNKHYSTVKHACDKIDGELSFDKELADVIEDIKNKITYDKS